MSPRAAGRESGGFFSCQFCGTKLPREGGTADCCPEMRAIAKPAARKPRKRWTYEREGLALELVEGDRGALGYLWVGSRRMAEDYTCTGIVGRAALITLAKRILSTARKNLLADHRKAIAALEAEREQLLDINQQLAIRVKELEAVAEGWRREAVKIASRGQEIIDQQEARLARALAKEE